MRAESERCVVLADGTGTRVGANILRKFIEVLGKPIIGYMLEIFQNNPEIDAIEEACHKDWVSEVENIAQRYNIIKLRWLTFGSNHMNIMQ